MTQSFQLGETVISFTCKEVKNVHLSVHPPKGHVTLVAPIGTRPEVARAYAISRLAWIHSQQERLRGQAREPARQFVERESHFLWGRRYLLSIVEHEARPSIKLDHRRITMSIRPGATRDQRATVVHDWHKALLHEEVPDLIRKWEKRLKVSVHRYFLQRMKTKWGSCNPSARHIRLNTELVKKPRDLLEYVIVHEMAHLIEATHSDRFVALLDRHFPTWREARSELNELPLADDFSQQS